MAIPHARALFGYVGSVVIGDTITVPHAADAWTGDGYAFSDGFDTHVQEALGRILNLAAGFAHGQQCAATSP
jgi:hypothetical protein